MRKTAAERGKHGRSTVLKKINAMLLRSQRAQTDLISERKGKVVFIHSG